MNTSKTNTTIGEELFLVHLRRCEGKSQLEDRDLPPELVEGRKRRADSIGEELWQVHLKRSRGVDVDDVDVAGPEQVVLEDPANHRKAPGRYNLRSRMTPTKK